MDIVRSIMKYERFMKDNTPEKIEARVKAKVEEIFPESYRKEMVNAILADFERQIKGMY